MNKTKLLAPLLFLLSISIDSGAASLDSLVRANNLNAAVVVKSLKTGKLDVYNPQRAALQFLPASTFKIPNTLIALQTHAISGLHDTIRWDGQYRSVDAWNHDQDLLSAFPYSCVWFYQVLAARIGNDTYLQYLQKLHYGNQLTGTDVTTFWLDGELRISALEQIGFLGCRRSCRSIRSPRYINHHSGTIINSYDIPRSTNQSDFFITANINSQVFYQ